MFFGFFESIYFPRIICIIATMNINPPTVVLNKINSLIKSTQRNDLLEGEDKPKPLKGNLQDYCSRPINHEHRLVYRVKENQIIIIKKSTSIH